MTNPNIPEAITAQRCEHQSPTGRYVEPAVRYFARSQSGQSQPGRWLCVRHLAEADKFYDSRATLARLTYDPSAPHPARWQVSIHDVATGLFEVVANEADFQQVSNWDDPAALTAAVTERLAESYAITQRQTVDFEGAVEW